MCAQMIETKILSRINGHKRGYVFTPGHFLDLGDRGAVGMAIKRLCDQGLIRRLARGLYDHPRTHPQLGVLSPTPEQIARALTEKDGSRIQPSGAYAANLLGLSEQVPAKAVFLTDAIDRRITVGRREIVLKRTTPKNMTTAGRTSGLVIQALRYMGQRHVDDAIVDRLARRIGKDDRQALMKDIHYAPAWIGAIFRRLAERED